MARTGGLILVTDMALEEALLALLAMVPMAPAGYLTKPGNGWVYPQAAEPVVAEV